MIIPQGGSYGAAVNALNALPSTAFAAAAAAIAASAGCPASSVTMSTVSITAACGGGVSNVTCSIPGAPAPGYTTNVDAVIGGVIGGALLFIIFVGLVLACRGYCACCADAGCGAPRRKAAGSDGDAAVAVGVAPVAPAVVF